MKEAGLVVDLSTPEADAMCTIEGLDTGVSPGSTVDYVAIVNAIKVRVSEIPAERGRMLPVLTRASVVRAEHSRTLFGEACREHAHRVARAIDKRGGGG